MHGLVRSSTCSSDTESQESHRLHYCGLCKFIGVDYGHLMRFVLNRDIVFMTELMTALTTEDANWPAPIKSRNCFRLPATRDGQWKLFRYAAAICVLAAEIQVQDNSEDGNFAFWKVVSRLFRKKFERARVILDELDFPIQDIVAHAKSQSAIERSQERISDPEEQVRIHAGPTRAMFSIVFAHAARIQGRADLSSPAASVGAGVGELLYLVDAAEDWSEDAKKLRFNSLRSAFHDQKLGHLPLHARASAQRFAAQVLQTVALALNSMGSRKIQNQRFLTRLTESVASRLEKADCRLRVTDRFHSARQTAREVMAKQAGRLGIRFRTAPTTLSAFVTTLIACAVFLRDLIMDRFATSPKVLPVVHQANCCGDICGPLCFCLLCAGCLSGGGGNRKEVIVIHKKAGPCD